MQITWKARPPLCMLSVCMSTWECSLSTRPFVQALTLACTTLFTLVSPHQHTQHNAMTLNAKLKWHWAERCTVTPTSPLPNRAWGKTTLAGSSKSSLDTRLSHSLERWPLGEDGIKHISVCWCFNVSRRNCWPGSTPNTGSAPVGLENKEKHNRHFSAGSTGDLQGNQNEPRLVYLHFLSMLENWGNFVW